MTSYVQNPILQEYVKNAFNVYSRRIADEDLLEKSKALDSIIEGQNIRWMDFVAAVHDENNILRGILYIKYPQHHYQRLINRRYQILLDMFKEFGL